MALSNRTCTIMFSLAVSGFCPAAPSSDRAVSDIVPDPEPTLCADCVLAGSSSLWLFVLVGFV